jgi:hypothetical protein
VVADRLEDYKQHQQAKNRHGMASVVEAIADEVHKSGGRFIDQNWRGTVRRISVYKQTYKCMLHRKHTSYSCHRPIASFVSLQWVELSAKDRRQKVDRACRDAKKNSVDSAGTAASRGSLQETPKVNTIDNSSNPSYKWEGREISTNTEDGRTCTQSSTPERARPPSPSTSVVPVVVESNSNNSNGDNDHNSNREPSPTPWRYQGTAPFLNTVTTTGTGACTAAVDAIATTTAELLHGKEERPLQQLWSELHRTGYQQPLWNEAMQGMQDDGNYRNHALRSSLATFEKVPATIAPMLEYSCGSLVHDESSCGSDHNMDQTSPLLTRQVTRPSHAMHTYHRQMAFPSNAATSYVWSTKFMSMDLNTSAVSAMDEDCSSVSFDFFNILGDGTESSSHDDVMVARTFPGKDPTVARTFPGKVGEENYPSSLTLLNSSVSGTDLSGSYKPPSTFSESNHVVTIDQEESRFHRCENTADSDPNVLQRHTCALYQARYVCLKREESIDTAVTGILKRCSKVVQEESDDWMDSSFNVSLDFTTVPSTTQEVLVVRRNDNWNRNTNNNSSSILARSWSSKKLFQSQVSTTLMNDPDAFGDAVFVGASSIKNMAIATAAMSATATSTHTNTTTTTTDTNAIGSLLR